MSTQHSLYTFLLMVVAITFELEEFYEETRVNLKDFDILLNYDDSNGFYSCKPYYFINIIKNKKTAYFYFKNSI